MVCTRGSKEVERGRGQRVRNSVSERRGGASKEHFVSEGVKREQRCKKATRPYKATPRGGLKKTFDNASPFVSFLILSVSFICIVEGMMTSQGYAQLCVYKTVSYLLLFIKRNPHSRRLFVV